MTNEIETSDAQEERSQIETLEGLDMASLRKYAKLMRINAQRDWQKEDYVEAIKTKQAAQNVSLVFDDSAAPAPGYARIKLNRDPTPGHRNSPVPAAVNGRIFLIPRGIPCDVPIPIVGVLKDSKGMQYNQTDGPSSTNPGGVYKEEEVSSYPFEILAITPGGKFTNENDPRAASYRRREAFHKSFGRWPTQGELQEAIRAQIIKET